MQDELRSVLDLMIQQDSTLEIHTTPDVYITQNSTPRDVRKWLRDKEFSQRYCITRMIYIHYHLEVQANPKKNGTKKPMLFLTSMGETGLSHDIFFKFSLGPFEVVEVE